MAARRDALAGGKWRHLAIIVGDIKLAACVWRDNNFKCKLSEAAAEIVSGGEAMHCRRNRENIQARNQRAGGDRTNGRAWPGYCCISMLYHKP